jgi:hypothetical protein
MGWNLVSGRSSGALAALAGGIMLAAAAVAQAQSGGTPSTTSDAQVESNVLQALAGASDLSKQNIQSSTVYGVVTLSGNVHSEAQRTEAENLAARAAGVKKVVDEITLGDTPPPQNEPAQASNESQAQAGGQGAQMETPPPGWVLQSDGTYAPPEGGQPQQASASPETSQAQGGYVQQGPPQQGYPQQGPPQQGYPQRSPMYGGQPYQAYAPPQGVARGQRPGMPVMVPQGAPLQVRINRGIDSNHIVPGTAFDGTVMNDIVAGGAVAIPRGAHVTGVVVDSKKAGALKGHGELSLQINSLTLGGQVYPLMSDVWERRGHDKTAGTVDRAVGLGALGALVGAVAGGGAGAAIGAGVGAGAGVASAAASPGGRVIIPPESVVTFQVAQSIGVHTVSEQEMARLSYAAGPTQPMRPAMRRYCDPYRGCYWGPAYPPAY